MSQMIRTPRLTLRTFQDTDLGPLRAVLGDPEVMAFSDHGALDDAECRAWLAVAQASARDTMLPHLLAICRQGEGDVIGYVSLSADPNRVSDREAELGFRLAAAHWGHGYATEAAGAMIADAGTLSGVDRIVVIVDPNNRPSLRVLAKINMTYVGEVTFPHYTYPDHKYAVTLAAGSC